MRFTKPIVMAGLLLVILAFNAAAFDKDSAFVGWKKSLVWDITTTQTAYSDSWTGGEAGSLNWQTNVNGKAAKHLSDLIFLRSWLKLAFGQTLTQDEDTKEWSKPQKSTDLIDWETVAEFKTHAFVDPYVAFRLESQFFDGRVRDKKLYFSPTKLTESAGGIREVYRREDDYVTTRIGLSARQIIKTEIVDVVTSGIAVDTVDFLTDDSVLTDLGVEWVTDAELSLSDKLLYTGKLTLNKAFLFSESDAVKGTPFEDDWKAIDVNWENIVSAEVSKIISVYLYTQLLYDKEVSKRARIKETLALGFVFKLI